MTERRTTISASAPAEKDVPGRADSIERMAAGIAPDDCDAWRTLADRFAREGDLAAADRAYLKHVATARTNPVLMRAGNALVQNDLAAAERLLKPFLQQYPTDVAAIRMLAEIAGRIGRYEEAESLLRRALELCPSFAAARFNLAIVLHRQHRSTEAAAELESLLDDDPDSPAYRNLHGAVLSRLGNYDDAVGQFERVLKDRPRDPHLWMNYGHALKTIGRRDESIAAYRRCIDLRKNLGEAWWSLANLKSRVFTVADIESMHEILSDQHLSAADRLHLHFALGAAHEDREAWAESFDHYSKANAMRRSQIRYDSAETWGIAARTSAFMSSHVFRDLLGAGCGSTAPIFIVGMPRSGSTLVEQILASHSLIEGTKELAEVSLLAGAIAKKKNSKGEGLYPGSIELLERSDIRALGESYIRSSLMYRKTDKPFFIDKMPNNWLHVALISLMLPNAKIIDVRRDPMDCCVSNFKQHFARGQHFSYSLPEVAEFYCAYMRVMNDAQIVRPAAVYRLHYESLVNDLESEARGLLGFLGVPFESSCTKFWENARAVQTASSEQVRRRIYRSGLGHWRHFTPWLGILSDTLNKHGVAAG
jgi:tetratricopeptide (TPR) repeat protein